MPQIIAKVRPNGAYSTYIGVGIVSKDGRFIRQGRIEDYPVLNVSWDYDPPRLIGKASYEKEATINVPENFPLWICRIQGHRNRGDFEVLFAPKENHE